MNTNGLKPNWGNDLQQMADGVERNLRAVAQASASRDSLTDEQKIAIAYCAGVGMKSGVDERGVFGLTIANPCCFEKINGRWHVMVDAR